MSRGRNRSLLSLTTLLAVACREPTARHMPEADPPPWTCIVAVNGVPYEGFGDTQGEALFHVAQAVQPVIAEACAGKTGTCALNIETSCRLDPS